MWLEPSSMLLTAADQSTRRHGAPLTPPARLRIMQTALSGIIGSNTAISPRPDTSEFGGTLCSTTLILRDMGPTTGSNIGSSGRPMGTRPGTFPITGEASTIFCFVINAHWNGAFTANIVPTFIENTTDSTDANIDKSTDRGADKNAEGTTTPIFDQHPKGKHPVLGCLPKAH